MVLATSPSLTTSQSAGIVPNPGTSFHSVCQPGTPRVSSWWSRESRSCSVAAMTDSVRSMASSMESRTAAMALLRQGREQESVREWIEEDAGRVEVRTFGNMYRIVVP